MFIHVFIHVFIIVCILTLYYAITYLMRTSTVMVRKYKHPNFSTSFDEARYKFISNVSNKWVLKQYNDNRTHIAVLENKNSNDWIIHTSGLHGIEGYTGSAIQLKIIEDFKEFELENYEELPNIMIVHCLNPFGMMAMQRTNKNNVDLNRNSIMNNNFKSKSFVFKDRILNNLVNPESILWYYAVPFLIIYSLVVYGLKASVRAIVIGQYERKHAMSYGGHEHESEIKNFFKAIAPFFNEHSRVYHIDVHTGFGKRMNEYLMVNTIDVKGELESTFHNGNYYINSQDPEYKHMKGGLIQGFEHLLHMYGNQSIQSYVGIVQEFGTVNYAGIPIFLAMRKSDFWKKYHQTNQCIYSSVKSELYELFNPQTKEYQTECLDKGCRRIYELVHYLQNLKKT